MLEDRLILPHTFREEDHSYLVDGHYVLSTSSVLGLAGYSDYSQIPQGVLDNAAHKGTQVHKAIEWFETDGEIPDIPEDYQGYFDAYLGFKTSRRFEAQDMEKQLVYVHEGTDQPIGCTVDLRGTMNGVKWILDIKTNARMYGKALRQKRLCWGLQLTSYDEATAAEGIFNGATCNRGIVQLFKDGSYEFHDFSEYDLGHLWDASIRVAVAKKAAGFEEKR